MDIGFALRLHRAMTQKTLANLVGISECHVRQIVMNHH